MGLALLSAVMSSLYDPMGALIEDGAFSFYLFGAFSYLGAFLIDGLVFLITYIRIKKGKRENDLLQGKAEWGIAIASGLFSVLANCLLLLALMMAPASQVALFSNAEIMCTSILAFFIFKEAIAWYGWAGIGLIISGVVILSLDFSSGTGITFSYASLLALGASLCWAFENNLTRLISNRNSAQIAAIKCSFGTTIEFIIAYSLGAGISHVYQPFAAMGVGSIAFGISLLFYLQAQRRIGAVKTSAFFVSAPFLGSILSLLIIHESPAWNFYLAFSLILLGQAIIAFFSLRDEKKRALKTKAPD